MGNSRTGFLRSSHLADRVAQRLLGVEADGGALDPAGALDVDPIVAVDHHLGDLGPGRRAPPPVPELPSPHLPQWSEANSELLKPVYDEWRRGNFDLGFELYADDWEWGWSDEFPDLGGVKPDPSPERLRDWLSPWERWQVEPEEFIASRDFVVVLCRYTGRGKGSGVDVETHGAHVWTIRDGKALRLEVFSSRAKALTAAGLDPDDAEG